MKENQKNGKMYKDGKLYKVVFPEKEFDKLYKIGFEDGMEIANKLENKKENLKNLNPVGPQKYLEGYRDGIQKAREDYLNRQEETSKKTR